MENYSTATKYAETATNSAGTALDKYTNSYLTSAAAAQAKFTAKFEKMSSTVMESWFIKGTINAGSGILGTLTWIIDKLGILIPLLATVGGVMAFKNVGEPSVLVV